VIPKRRLRPSDWVNGRMTVCIAATVLQEYVVTISDRKVSMPGFFSADHVMDKIDPVHPSWAAMVSAEDVTDAIPIWDKVRKKLGFEAGLKGPRPPEKKVDEVSSAFISAFQEERKERITNQFFATYGWTPEKFLAEGRKVLGLSLFTDLWNKVHQFRIGCDFLVAGFDANKEAHIFTAEDPGICKSYGSLGFWAIGSGQQQALASIFFSFKDVNTNPVFESILYDLCAAKFMAESAEGVGEATNILVHRFGERPKFMPDAGVKAMRDAWEKHGRPRTPEGIAEIVKKNPLVSI